MDGLDSLPAALLDVVVLAGGDSVELMPLTATEIKSMLCVCNRPLIWYCLRPWVAAGFRTFFLCVNENNLVLRSYLAREFGGVEFHFILVPLRVNDHASTTCDAVKAFLTYKHSLRTSTGLEAGQSEFDNVNDLCLDRAHALSHHRMNAPSNSGYHHNHHSSGSSTTNNNSSSNNSGGGDGGSSSVNSGRDALREERAARAGLRRDCVLLSCDTILAGVNIRRFVSLHYGSFASVSAMMFRPNNNLAADAAPGAASAAASAGGHAHRNAPKAVHHGKAGNTPTTPGNVVCTSPDYRYIAVGYEEEHDSDGLVSVPTCLIASGGSVGPPTWQPPPSSTVMSAASLAVPESALSWPRVDAPAALTLNSGANDSSFHAASAAAAAVGESASGYSLALPPSPPALIMMSANTCSNNYSNSSFGNANYTNMMQINLATNNVTSNINSNNNINANNGSASVNTAPPPPHCRLHYMCPLAEKPEVRVTMAFAARRPQLTFAADVVDAHVYLVRDWVLDFIAASAGDAEASISHTIVPLLARSQHTTVNLSHNVVITPEQKIKHNIPLHWMYDGRDVNISRLNALSTDPLPCKADDLRVFCTIVEETAHSACKIYRINSRANYQAIQSEILAAKCFLLNIDRTSDSTGVVMAERALRERSLTMMMCNDSVRGVGGRGSSAASGVPSHAPLRVQLPITSHMVGLTPAAPSPNVTKTSPNAANTKAAAGALTKGKGGSRLTVPTASLTPAVMYPSRLAIAQLHPDNPFTLRESAGSLRIHIINSFIDSTVPPNVYISNSVIGKNAILGTGARITDSVVMENVEIGAKAVVTRSIIGSSAIVNKGKHVINSTVAPRCIVENDEQDNVVE